MKKQKLLIISSLLLFSTLTACQNTSISSSLIEKTVTEISLKSKPSKLEYEVNENLDLTGTKITVKYNDGTSEDIDVTSSMINKVDMTSEGKKEIKITYLNKSISFEINVVDNRAECPITFTGEREYIYDGTSKNIDFTIPENVKYNAQYEQDGSFYSKYENAPIDIGTYALVIKTEATSLYKQTTKWFTFTIVENKPEAVVTFSSETIFYYDGEGHTPTYIVEGNLEAEVEYRYVENEMFVSYEAPSAIGNYVLCVEVKASSTTRLTRAYKQFSIVAKPEVEKENLVINIEPGQKVKQESEIVYSITHQNGEIATDANVKLSYEAEGFHSDTFPTVAGDYNVIVTILESDKYNEITTKVWFRLLSLEETKIDCPITFNAKKDYTLGEEATIEIVVPEGVTYTAYYEVGGKKYSDFTGELPLEAGTYSLVVDTNETDIYASTHAWYVFNVTSKPKCPVTFNGKKQYILGEEAVIEIVVPEGIEIENAHYEKNEKYYSEFNGAIPSEAGDYSLVVDTKENDTYSKNHVWFTFSVIENTTKPKCSITFDAKESYTLGEEATIEIVVPKGVEYTAYYEKGGEKYSDFTGSIPSEAGTYSLVVDTKENDIYQATHNWYVFTVV